MLIIVYYEKYFQATAKQNNFQLIAYPFKFCCRSHVLFCVQISFHTQFAISIATALFQ